MWGVSFGHEASRDFMQGVGDYIVKPTAPTRTVHSKPLPAAGPRFAVYKYP